MILVVQRPFLNPLTFNLLRRGDSLGATVVESGQLLDDHGSLWQATGDDPLPYSVGVTGKLHLRGRHVSFTSMEELIEAEQRRVQETESLRRQRELEGENEAQIAKEKAAANAAFNASLALPVAWVPAEKYRTSWLTYNARSQNGTSRQSVVHIMLHEPLAIGRLSRPQGSLLCQPITTDLSDSGWGVTPRVSCKRCLEIAARLRC